MDNETITAAVAGYAAIVATGALALEVRRWFESGPRLVIGIMAPAIGVGAFAQDDREYIFVEVSNRGSSATTITNLGLMTFRSRWRRFRRHADVQAIVPRPEIGASGQVPSVLRPGERWTRIINFEEDVVDWAMSDTLFVTIHHTGAGKPAMKKVRLSATSKAKRA